MTARSLVPAPIKDVIRRGTRLLKNDASYVRHRYLGCDLEMNIGDDLAAGWYDRDWFDHERREFAEIERFDPPADGIAFNLGAHHGLISMLMKKKLFPTGKIISVEIDSINFNTCRKNLIRNRILGIECLNLAISNVISSVQFAGSSNSSIDMKPSMIKKIFGMEVRSTTIDRLCRRFGFPFLIYMDIEGAEILALQGAHDALREVSIWFIELHGDLLCTRYGGQNMQVGRTLLENGYRLSLSLDESEDFLPICEVEEIPSQRCHVIASK